MEPVSPLDKARMFTDFVRETACGSWGHVLAQLAPEIAPALLRPRSHFPCPMHGGKDGFRVYPDFEHTGGGVCNTCRNQSGGIGFHDGFSLLMWLKGWDFTTTVSEVAWALGLTQSQHRAPSIPTPPPVSIRPPARTADEDARNFAMRSRMQEYWQSAYFLNDPRSRPAHLYLKNRGLKHYVLSPWLRFHPSIPYFDQDQRRIGKFPCILGKYVRMDLQPVTLHRTYITERGAKADVPEPRKMMPVPTDVRTSGSAIRLDAPGPILAVGEGIETMLSVRSATKLPCWAAGSAMILAAMEIPPGTQLLCIFADHDRSNCGVGAANVLAKRAKDQGIQRVIFLPDDKPGPSEKGVDWNDIMKRYGPRGFPTIDDIRGYLYATHR